MFIIPTPLGDLDAAFDERGRLARLMFVPPATATEGRLDNAQAAMARLLAQEIKAYFAGKLREFSVPLALCGTDFQRRVWGALTRIPYGSTTTYGQIAEGLGDSKLSRAVGRANGANPVFILIPCHRVIGANGALTGYAGGLERKAGLLELEGRRPNAQLRKPHQCLF